MKIMTQRNHCWQSSDNWWLFSTSCSIHAFAIVSSTMLDACCGENPRAYAKMHMLSASYVSLRVSGLGNLRLESACH